MSEKPRRWFQIHLSTAIVLMVVAGALLWANIGPLKDETVGFVAQRGIPSEWIPIQKTMRLLGWPALFYGANERRGVSQIYFVTGTSIHYAPLIFDVLFAGSILFGSLCACEWHIRRREARKP